jgi:hypothetical protein
MKSENVCREKSSCLRPEGIGSVVHHRTAAVVGEVFGCLVAEVFHAVTPLDPTGSALKRLIDRFWFMRTALPVFYEVTQKNVHH